MSEDPADPPGGLRSLLRAGITAESQLLLRTPPPGPVGRVLRALQVLLLSLRRYREDHAGDRAAALAFTTLLSLLPMLLLALAVLGRAAVAGERLAGIRAWILENMVPEAAQEMGETLDAALATLRQAKRGLGLLGFAALVYTGWKLVATLDRTFQKIAGDTRLSSRVKRLAGFSATAAAVPLLAGASVVISGVAETLASRHLLPGGALPGSLRWVVPLLPVGAGLVLAYRFCGGERIAWRSAILGATLAAVCLEILKAGFAAYLRHALVARTLLAGMGVLPIFLVWLYFSWVLFLAGAEVTLAADDYPATLRRSGLEPA